MMSSAILALLHGYGTLIGGFLMAYDILERIASDKRIQVEEEKNRISLEEMKQKALQTKSMLPAFSFKKALGKEGMSFICEVKKASPSKGIIAEDFPYVKIAEEYERAGADCLSVLTEEKYFLGCDEYLEEIRGAVDIPILRKDFVIDVYQIYQAKVIGADAVLLIVALLDEDTIREYIDVCNELGLSALVETHDENEINIALSAGAKIIGVNNRNLKDFSVDISNTTKLREYAPKEVLFVAESGIKTREDVECFEKQDTNAVLIGETLMRADDKKKKLDELKGLKY